MTIALAFALAFLVSTGSGCSFSKSSESISNSISSPFEWSGSSSDSSSDGDDGGSSEPETKQDTQAYAEDVVQLAYTFGTQGGDIGSLRSSVSSLAMKRGMTNWETDALTSQSIGKGVRKAGMNEEEFRDFSKRLFGDDLTKASELQKGYQPGQPPKDG